jgi:dipeptidyl aminopeptidase/acylaminoacyl peptidase
MGVSMGGGGALTFSLRHPDKVTAVCDIMGVTDFVRFYEEGHYQNSISPAFGGSPEEKPDVYRQRSAIRNIDVLKKLPLLILHGADDTLVPLWNSETLYEKLRQAGGKVEFLKVPHIAHDNGIIAGLEDKVLDFFGSIPD